MNDTRILVKKATWRKLGSVLPKIKLFALYRTSKVFVEGGRGHTGGRECWQRLLILLLPVKTSCYLIF